MKVFHFHSLAMPLKMDKLAEMEGCEQDHYTTREMASFLRNTFEDGEHVPDVALAWFYNDAADERATQTLSLCDGKPGADLLREVDELAKTQPTPTIFVNLAMWKEGILTVLFLEKE